MRVPAQQIVGAGIKKIAKITRHVPMSHGNTFPVELKLPGPTKANRPKLARRIPEFGNRISIVIAKDKMAGKNTASLQDRRR